MSKCQYRFFSLLFFLLICARPTYSQSLPESLIFLNDTTLTMNHSPRLINQHLYVNLRDIAPYLDLTISYDSAQRTALAQSDTHLFRYFLDTEACFLDDIPVILDDKLLIIDDATWVPIISFSKLFGFEAEYNHSLLISTYQGMEETHLDYIPDPITYPTYTYTSVVSAFINEAFPGEIYMTGTYPVRIEEAYFDANVLYVTITPYTEVSYPDGYDLISDPRLFNFSSTRFSFPIDQQSSYTYLTYTPTTFSSETTSDTSLIWEDAQTNELILASVEVLDGVIYSLKQIYVP